MSHRLDPLLRPQSIAVVGATVKKGRVGSRTITNLLAGHYPGRLFAVNPGYTEVHGVPCFPAIHDLPETVEHVVFAVSDERIEAVLDEVISAGVKAVTIMSTLVLADDAKPPLKERIHDKVSAAGLLVCGGNGMGFYNFQDRVWACGFDTRPHCQGGNVALISHSGSGMAGIIDVEERIDFCLAVSTGQELVVTMADYLDFALDMPDVRAVGLFMETARDPDALIASLEKAHDKHIPVVAIKVGRTDLAARLTVSHSGAMAGADAAFDALFDRHGVQKVRDMDELATALIMFAQPHPVSDGGLATLHDSGGERQLLIDLADEFDVALTELEQESVEKLARVLEPGLAPVNPLDAWSVGGPDAHIIMQESMKILMTDPGTAVGAVIQDRAPKAALYSAYVDYMRAGHGASGKPVFLVASRQGTGTDPAAISVTREGFPVLDGVASFLTGVRCLFGHRDYLNRPDLRLPEVADDVVNKWQDRLNCATMLEDTAAREMISDFGLAVTPLHAVDNPDAAVAAADEIRFPVVMKTAAVGIAHKSDTGGVRLGLCDECEVLTAYDKLSHAFGPRVTLAPMIGPGVEMILGIVQDEQFGPMVVIGSGGIHAEVLDDVVFALPPFDAARAQQMTDKLKMRPLLDGQRGRPPADIDAFCDMAARVSVMAQRLAGSIGELDLNPVIVDERGCVAVDWLVVPGGDVSVKNEQRKAV